MKSKQEILDTVYDHFINQGKPFGIDRGAGGCVYLGEGGCKCAIGIFIPDGHPAQKVQKVINKVVETHSDLLQLINDDIGFLREIQTAHDQAAFNYRAEATDQQIRVFAGWLRAIATRYDLMDPGRESNPVKARRETVEMLGDIRDRALNFGKGYVEEWVTREVSVTGGSATTPATLFVHMPQVELTPHGKRLLDEAIEKLKEKRQLREGEGDLDPWDKRRRKKTQEYEPELTIKTLAYQVLDNWMRLGLISRAVVSSLLGLVVALLTMWLFGL